MDKDWFKFIVQQIDDSGLVETDEDGREVYYEEDQLFASWNVKEPQEISLQVIFTPGHQGLFIQEIENPHNLTEVALSGGEDIVGLVKGLIAEFKVEYPGVYEQ